MDTYEKKYNEALNWMRELYPGLHGATKEDAEHYFPELSESEDERIRIALCDIVRDMPYMETELRAHGLTVEKAIAYLEKQKEQKHYWKPTETDTALFNKAVTTNKALTPTERAQLDIIRSKFGYCRAANCSGIVQEEQEPAEVIKDRRQISFMIEDAWRCGVIEGRKQVIDNPEEYGLQKQAEWSEEDEKTLNLLIETLDDNSHYFPFKETKMKMIHLLKSLRSSWKPSEDQMDALKELIDDANKAGWVTPGATELYEQLKKLM